MLNSATSLANHTFVWSGKAQEVKVVYFHQNNTNLSNEALLVYQPYHEHFMTSVKLEKGTHYYYFIVDGARQVNPDESVVVKKKKKYNEIVISSPRTSDPNSNAVSFGDDNTPSASRFGMSTSSFVGQKSHNIMSSEISKPIVNFPKSNHTFVWLGKAQEVKVVYFHENNTNLLYTAPLVYQPYHKHFMTSVKLEKGTYYYYFKVDGMRQLDPEEESFFKNQEKYNKIEISSPVTSGSDPNSHAASVGDETRPFGSTGSTAPTAFYNFGMSTASFGQRSYNFISCEINKPFGNLPNLNGTCYFNAAIQILKCTSYAINWAACKTPVGQKIREMLSKPSVDVYSELLRVLEPLFGRDLQNPYCSKRVVFKIIEYIGERETDEEILKAIRFSKGRLAYNCLGCGKTDNGVIDNNLDQLYIVTLANKSTLQERVHDTFYSIKEAMNCSCLYKGFQTEQMIYEIWPNTVLIRTSPSMQDFKGTIVLPNNKQYQLVAIEINSPGHSTALVKYLDIWYLCDDQYVKEIHSDQVPRIIENADPKGDALCVFQSVVDKPVWPPLQSVEKKQDGIKTIFINSGSYINYIQVLSWNGSVVSQAGVIDPDAQNETIVLDDNEVITKMALNRGTVVDRVAFYSNNKKEWTFGGNGGYWKESEEGKELVSLEMGVTNLEGAPRISRIIPVWAR